MVKLQPHTLISVSLLIQAGHHKIKVGVKD